MKKIQILLLFLSLSTSCFAQTTRSDKPNFTHLDKIVAVVNKEVITQTQLNNEIENIKKQFDRTNQPLPPASELRTKTLESLIAKNIQLQMCKEKNISANDEDIQKAIEHIAKNNNISLAQLKEAVEQSGIHYDEYKSQLKEQLTLQKLQQEAIVKNLVLTPEDVKKFTRENQDKLNRYNAFHVIDMMLPIAENATQDQLGSLKAQATEIAKQLQKGKSPDDIVKQFPCAQNNDLGWRAIGEFPSLFQSKVAALKIKAASAPIMAPNGIHILQLLEAKGDNAKFTENNLKNLAFQYKVSQAVNEWVQKLRKDTYVRVMN